MSRPPFPPTPPYPPHPCPPHPGPFPPGKRVCIKGELDIGVSPKVLAVLEKYKKDTESSYPKVIKYVKDYLYETWYSNIDYNYAEDYYYKEGDTQIPPACSSIRKGNWFGRNLDWTYSEGAEFIVHTPRYADRYSVVGVSGIVPKLTDHFVKTGEYDDHYKIIPFQLLDGINEYGLVASVNVVPTDKGQNIAYPKYDSRITMCASMLIRYLLDHFKTAKEAVNYVRDYMTIYFPKNIHGMHCETHYLICDERSSYIIEFDDNSTKIIDTGSTGTEFKNASYMTNFMLCGVSLNEDGKVYTPYSKDEDHDAQKTNNITAHGIGLERYNYIVDSIPTLNNYSDMHNLLYELRYTKAYPAGGGISPYDNPDEFRFTEFVGSTGDPTVSSNLDEFYPIIDVENEKFINRTRNKKSPFYGTWHTQHSSIYDIRQRKLYLNTQEDFNDQYEFVAAGSDYTVDFWQIPSNPFYKTSENQIVFDNEMGSFIVKAQETRIKTPKIYFNHEDGILISANSGILNVNNNRIRNILTDENSEPTDAVTKGYVDKALENKLDRSYKKTLLTYGSESGALIVRNKETGNELKLDAANGTLIGIIKVPDNPTAVANKKYVDDKVIEISKDLPKKVEKIREELTELETEISPVIKKVAGIEEGAQANRIEKIMFNGEEVGIEGKVADITLDAITASDDKLGMIKGSSSVHINENGELEIKEVHVSTLVADEDEYLELDCGGAII